MNIQTKKVLDAFALGTFLFSLYRDGEVPYEHPHHQKRLGISLQNP